MCIGFGRRLQLAPARAVPWLFAVTDAPAPAPDPLWLAGLNGTTAALTARVAHLLHTGKAWPSEILALTFTQAAECRFGLTTIVLLHAPSG